MLIKGKSYLISFTALFAEKEYTLTYDYYVPMEVHNEFPLSAPAISTWKALKDDSERLGVKSTTAVGVFGKLLGEGALRDVYANEPEGIVPSEAVLRLVGHIHAAIQAEGRARDVDAHAGLSTSRILDRAAADVIEHLSKGRVVPDFRYAHGIETMSELTHRFNAEGIVDMEVAAETLTGDGAETVAHITATDLGQPRTVEVVAFLSAQNTVSTLESTNVELSPAAQQVEYKLEITDFAQGKRLGETEDGSIDDGAAFSSERVKQLTLEDVADGRRIEPEYLGDIETRVAGGEGIKQAVIDSAVTDIQKQTFEMIESVGTEASEKRERWIEGPAASTEAVKLDPAYQGDIADGATASEHIKNLDYSDREIELASVYEGRPMDVTDPVTGRNVSDDKIVVLDEAPTTYGATSAEGHVGHAHSAHSRKDADHTDDQLVTATSYSVDIGAVHMDDITEGKTGSMLDALVSDSASAKVDRVMEARIDIAEAGSSALTLEGTVEETAARSFTYPEGEAVVDSLESGGAETLHEVFQQPEVMSVMRLAEILYGKRLVEEIMHTSAGLLSTVGDITASVDKGRVLDDRFEGVMDIETARASHSTILDTAIEDPSVADSQTEDYLTMEHPETAEVYGGSGGVIDTPNTAESYAAADGIAETIEWGSHSSVLDATYEGHDKASLDTVRDALISLPDRATCATEEDAVLEGHAKAIYSSVAEALVAENETSKQGSRADAVIDYTEVQDAHSVREAILEHTGLAEPSGQYGGVIELPELADTFEKNGVDAENNVMATTYSSSEAVIESADRGTRKKRIRDLLTSWSDSAARSKLPTDTAVSSDEQATRSSTVLDTAVSEDETAGRHKVLDTTVSRDETAFLHLEPEPKKAKRIWLILGRIASWNIWNWRKTR